MQRRRMDKLNVGERMARDVVTLQENDKLADGIRLSLQCHIRHIPVLSGKKVVGILSDRDVKKSTPSVLSGVDRDRFYDVIETTPVSKVMSKPPVTVSPQASISEAVRTMVSKRVGCLPVVEEDRLVGIITQADMMDLFLEELDERSPA